MHVSHLVFCKTFSCHSLGSPSALCTRTWKSQPLSKSPFLWCSTHNSVQIWLLCFTFSSYFSVAVHKCPHPIFICYFLSYLISHDPFKKCIFPPVSWVALLTTTYRLLLQMGQDGHILLLEHFLEGGITLR